MHLPAIDVDRGPVAGAGAVDTFQPGRRVWATIAGILLVSSKPEILARAVQAVAVDVIYLLPGAGRHQQPMQVYELPVDPGDGVQLPAGIQQPPRVPPDDRQVGSINPRSTAAGQWQRDGSRYRAALSQPALGIGPSPATPASAGRDPATDEMAGLDIDELAAGAATRPVDFASAIRGATQDYQMAEGLAGEIPQLGHCGTG